MKMEQIAKPEGVDPVASPVRIFLGGTWQIVWVNDVEGFVSCQVDLGYDVAPAQ